MYVCVYVCVCGWSSWLLNVGTMKGVEADHVKEGKALYEEAWQIKPSVLYLKVFSSNPVWSKSYSKWIINYLT